MLQEEHSAILLTFIKLPFVIEISVLSFFEWPFYTDSTILCKMVRLNCNDYLPSVETCDGCPEEPFY